MKVLYFETEKDFLNTLDGKVYSIGNAENSKFLCDILEDDFITTDLIKESNGGKISDWIVADEAKTNKLLKKAVLIKVKDKPYILSDYIGNKIENECANIYRNNDGYSKVIAYCDKFKLNYNYCRNCENEMPMIQTEKTCSCAICGSNLN